jgi:hypothetical protein
MSYSSSVFESDVGSVSALGPIGLSGRRWPQWLHITNCGMPVLNWFTGSKKIFARTDNDPALGATID